MICEAFIFSFSLKTRHINFAKAFTALFALSQSHTLKHTVLLSSQPVKAGEIFSGVEETTSSSSPSESKSKKAYEFILFLVLYNAVYIHSYTTIIHIKT